MNIPVQEPKAVDDFSVPAQKVLTIEDMDQKQLSTLEIGAHERLPDTSMPLGKV